jgi:hypothetical protein
MVFDVATGAGCDEWRGGGEGFSGGASGAGLRIGFARGPRLRLAVAMKARWWMALVFAAAAIAAEPDIELTGVLGSGKDTRVALKTKDNPARWLSIGQQFVGYTVSSYDPKEEMVVLTRDGQQLRLSLRKARIAHGAPEPAPEVKRAMMNNLRQLAAAADQFYLENGKTTVTYEQLVGPTKYVKQINPIAGEDYRAITFQQGKALTVTTAGGYVLSYA